MKPLLVISAPCETFSGYGARSRDIALSIIKSEKYDVKILSQRWGSTPYGFLKDSNPDHKLIKDCILAVPQLPKQPDVWIQITVPNEMQRIGKFNILITAGIETTICDPSWIEGCNNADLVLVSSEHAKTVFQNSKFEKRNSQTQQIESIVELKTSVEVLFEGVNTDIYNKIDKFNNIDSIMDRDEMLDKIRAIQQYVGGDLPPVYLLHGEFSDEDINELYNHPKIKAFVSFTKGEGYGRPLLEFTTSQKPVIAPNWSGHVDFLSELSTLLPGMLTPIHPSAVIQNMILPESAWFTVNDKEASKTLEDVFKNYKKYTDKAKRQAHHSKTEFSLEKMSEKLLTILDSKVPKPVQLKLPQLKKIELPKLKKIE